MTYGGECEGSIVQTRGAENELPVPTGTTKKQPVGFGCGPIVKNKCELMGILFLPPAHVTHSG